MLVMYIYIYVKFKHTHVRSITTRNAVVYIFVMLIST